MNRGVALTLAAALTVVVAGGRRLGSPNTPDAETWEKVLELLRSPDPSLQAQGLEVLATLGVTPRDLIPLLERRGGAWRSWVEPVDSPPRLWPAPENRHAGQSAALLHLLAQTLTAQVFHFDRRFEAGFEDDWPPPPGPPYPRDLHDLAQALFDLEMAIRRLHGFGGYKVPLHDERYIQTRLSLYGVDRYGVGKSTDVRFDQLIRKGPDPTSPAEREWWLRSTSGRTHMMHDRAWPHPAGRRWQELRPSVPIAWDEDEVIVHDIVPPRGIPSLKRGERRPIFSVLTRDEWATYEGRL